MNGDIDAVIQKSSRTFYSAGRLFPTDIRRDVFILYAYVRIIDDLVDTVPIDKRAVKHIKEETRNALAGKPVSNPFVTRFAGLATRKKIPHAWIWDYFASQELNYSVTRFRTDSDLERFIYGVAEVIGLMMAVIMDLPKSSYPSARALGKAMQVLNIIRDIPEDYRIGRVYIPETDLKRFELLNLPLDRFHGEKSQNLIRFEIDRFFRILESAKSGLRMIPSRVRLPISVAVSLYEETARKISHHPESVYRGKVRPSQGMIIRMIIQEWIRSRWNT